MCLFGINFSFLTPDFGISTFFELFSSHFEAGLITQILISCELTEDNFICGGAKDGGYSLKSSYHIINSFVTVDRASSNKEEDYVFLNKLWKINIQT